MKRLILASTSPRRKELLEKTGLQFEVIPSNYEEDMTLPLPPIELARHLSKGKTELVAKENPDTVVLGADTFVVYESEILGKPHTAEKAKETLLLLSGNVHSIITGFTIIDSASSKSVSEAVETKVYFRNLTEQEIDDYVATGEPLDKAGAYAIQAQGKAFVDHLEGDYDNVVGLPVAAVLQKLKEFEIDQ